MSEILLDTRAATVGADDATVGSDSWINTGNITADDGSFATVGVAGSTSHYLRASVFGFTRPGEPAAVPSRAIVGVKWKQALVGGSQDITDTTIKLHLASGFTGSNVALSNSLPTVSTLAEYNITWAFGTIDWDDVEHASFGFGVSLTGAGVGAATGSVDYMEMSVYYDPGTGLAPIVGGAVHHGGNKLLGSGFVYRKITRFTELIQPKLLLPAW